MRGWSRCMPLRGGAGGCWRRSRLSERKKGCGHEFFESVRVWPSAIKYLADQEGSVRSQHLAVASEQRSERASCQPIVMRASRCWVSVGSGCDEPGKNLDVPPSGSRPQPNRERTVGRVLLDGKSEWPADISTPYGRCQVVLHRKPLRCARYEDGEGEKQRRSHSRSARVVGSRSVVAADGSAAPRFFVDRFSLAVHLSQSAALMHAKNGTQASNDSQPSLSRFSCMYLPSASPK
jgi:hypothetical protein